MGVRRHTGQAHQRHGTDNYYVAGEGLLSTAEIAETSQVSAAARDAASQSPPFRFSRVGPKPRSVEPLIRQRAFR